MQPRRALTSNRRRRSAPTEILATASGIRRALALAGLVLLGVGSLRAQASAGAQEAVPDQPVLRLAEPSEGSGTAPPITITLQDALERARKNNPEYLSAVTDARNAHEDRLQARASLLPSVNTTTQELLTTGGSVLPTGRFVTNDGVHVYRAWGVFHEDLNPNLFALTGYRKASAAEALAQAKVEIARRGLTVTVTQNYYALVVGQRRYATAQQSLEQANQFLKTTREREQGGEAAHSDVIKAQLQAAQQQQAFQEAQLAMESARLNLAVLLFPALNENFTAVDDLDQAPPLPPFEDARALAVRANPDLKVALESERLSDLEVSAARNSFLPSLSIDTDYGIESNFFALRGPVAGVSDQPPPKNSLQQNNLGQFTSFNLQLPIWDWGILRSKLHQAEWRRQQARLELTAAQRRIAGSLYSSYNEAAVARSEVDLLRQSANLAAESSRLTTLRYQAGEANALEVVDAQNSLTQSRNAYDDGQARYRVALATLQTVTGAF